MAVKDKLIEMWQDTSIKSKKNFLAGLILFLCAVIVLPNILPSLRCLSLELFRGFSFGCIFRSITTGILLFVGAYIIIKFRDGGFSE
jgi:hypothetical protein